MARNFKELEAKMRPQRRARAKARAKVMMAEMLLAEIRRTVGLTPELWMQRELYDAATGNG